MKANRVLGGWAGCGLVAFGLMAAASSVSAQETIRITVATAHPVTIPNVRYIKEAFIPAVDAELAKAGEVKIHWVEGYGGTIVKLGSEVEAFQQGIMDVGQMNGVFNPAQLGLLNLSYAMPFGSSSAREVTAAAEKALAGGPLEALEQATGIVYIGGGTATDNYGIGSTKALGKLADLNGLKIGGAGSGLVWLGGTGGVGVQGSFITFYNDIKTGVYDGYIGLLTSAAPSRLYEVAPYWNEVDFGAMYIGGLGVSKARWDTFSESTKAAFRAGAAAYSKAYFDDLELRYEAGRKTLLDNGGQVVPLDAAERSAWIKALPNPAASWIKAAEARGEPARQVLDAYRDNLKAAGFTFERDYASE